MIIVTGVAVRWRRPKSGQAALAAGPTGVATSETRPTSPEEGEALGAAPELYRARARSTASLSATAAGAAVAGLIFGSTSLTLPLLARWVGIAAAGMLLLCTAAYVSASNYRVASDTSSDAAYYEGLRAVAEEIDRRTRRGSKVGVVALLAVLATVLAGTVGPKDSREVRVTLTVAALERARTLCPGLGAVVSGRAETPALGATGALLEIEVTPPQCDHERSVRLHLPRSSVVAIAH